jgi:glycerophosphoryl diester phosphodiesterase
MVRRVMVAPTGLRWIGRYADGIGANKNLIVPRDAGGFLLRPTSLIRDAHREHLVVHAWTFRNENTFLPANFRIGTDPAAWGRIRAAARYLHSRHTGGPKPAFSSGGEARIHETNSTKRPRRRRCGRRGR